MQASTKVLTAAVAVVAILAGGGLLAWSKLGGENSVTGQLASVEIQEIAWADLIPEDFVQPENPFETMSQEEIDKLMDGSDESNARLEELKDAFFYAPVVEDLDGKRVKIAAYVTPLEFEDQNTASEFLLVPYLGACIHTPPPPANQIVHAMSPIAVEIRSMYEPVWATGTVRTETVESDLATSGYRLDVESVEPYIVQ